ncbi:MAG: hypothetical protein JWM91_2121 [Rhodospirillales bacterium]|nr:hypothetical protein [Rhodospirillales bacterium]
MTSHKISTSFLRLGTVFAVGATALGGCSTVKSVSPFGSSVPYAANVQPTIARPTVTEIPAFKPKPEAPPAPKPEAPPAPKPVASGVASPPPAPATPPAAEPSAPPPPKSSAAQVPPPKVADAEPAPASTVAPPAKPATPEKIADESAAPARTGDSEAGQGPSLPADHRKLSEDGAYPNLAQVPARPVNLPSFAEAAALEKSLISNREKARDAAPASPDAPSVDSTPVPVPQSKPQAQPAMTKAVAVPARAEDRAPCLNRKAVDGQLAATLHFDPGSAALTAGNLALLAEAIPTMRAAKGTIRIFGHGDADTAAAVPRFDLAAARAAAVAQAVAGYGIPAPRIAVGVACADAAFAGASVQLYAES